jgi:hypothetical protein
MKPLEFGWCRENFSRKSLARIIGRDLDYNHRPENLTAVCEVGEDIWG